MFRFWTFAKRTKALKMCTGKNQDMQHSHLLSGDACSLRIPSSYSSQCETDPDDGMRADCRLVPWHGTRVTPPAFVVTVVTVVRSGAVVWPRMEPLSALPKAYRRLSGWRDSWTSGTDNDQLKPRNASGSDIWSSNATYLSYRGGACICTPAAI